MVRSFEEKKERKARMVSNSRQQPQHRQRQGKKSKKRGKREKRVKRKHTWGHSSSIRVNRNSKPVACSISSSSRHTHRGYCADHTLGFLFLSFSRWHVQALSLQERDNYTVTILMTYYMEVVHDTALLILYLMTLGHVDSQTPFRP